MEPDTGTKQSVRKTICARALRTQYRLSLTRSNGRLSARRITRETFAGDPPFEAASEAASEATAAPVRADFLLKSWSDPARLQEIDLNDGAATTESTALFMSPWPHMASQA
jgi:hypothetical protein